MKGFILGFALALTMAACSMSGKLYKNAERNFNDKMFEPCLNGWVDSPVGKFCNRSCPKRKKNGECKVELKTVVKDFCKESDFNEFRSGSFILIDEDQVL